MKIGEFAEMNHVTTKMLRHYDDIGLLRPSMIDAMTGYRSYTAQQSHVLNWIIILKNLDFPLARIKAMLNGPVDGRTMIQELIAKRIEISSAMNTEIQKKIGIDRLIRILEKEGFHMDTMINLLSIEQESVHEIKKNMPNMEMFLEEAQSIAALCAERDPIAVLRFDIDHFKQVNDDYGFDVGDKVIVACYRIIKANLEKHLVQATLGRAGGDEFIICSRAGKNEAERAAQGIIRDMETADFSVLGCHKQMTCSIGGLIGHGRSTLMIRKMIDDSIEALYQIKTKGRNGVLIIPAYSDSVTQAYTG